MEENSSGEDAPAAINVAPYHEESAGKNTRNLVEAKIVLAKTNFCFSLAQILKLFHTYPQCHLEYENIRQSR